LKTSVQQLREERDLPEQFVAALSHDLRTPLAAAKIGAQVLGKKSNEPEAVRRLASLISDCVDRADQMIGDLLDANRVSAGGKLALRIEPCVLNDLAVHTVEELKTLLGDHFIVRASASIEGWWSATALSRILENLCNNAIKYWDAEAPVTISLSLEGEVVQMAVHNEGPPIPPADVATLFEQHRRTAGARASGKPGWGLGLALVRGLAESHRGSVRMPSTAEEGTTFWVSLPRDARPPTDQVRIYVQS